MTQVCRSGVLLSLAVALISQVSVGQECDWNLKISLNQGLDPRSFDAGAIRHAILRDIKDEEGCRQACCDQPECDIAAIGTPADDGTPECFLFGCMSDGKDVCILQPNSQFRLFYRKKKAQDSEVKKPKKVHIELLQANPPKAENDSSINADTCRLPEHTGPCRASFPAFYYDVTNQTCKPFVYGGCDSNGNNFETLEACEAACSGVTGSVLTEDSVPENSGASRKMLPHPADDQVLAEDGESAPAETQSAAPSEAPVFSVNATETALPEMAASEYAKFCEAEPAMGPCRAALTHWYYDSEKRTCQTFLYGGCRGNKNNYLDESSCMATCTVTVIPSPRIVPESAAPDTKASGTFDEFCMAESDSGPCRAAFPMFYYELSSGTCQSFTYGGCGGNNNRYETLSDCMTRCSGIAVSFPTDRGFSGKRWSPAPFFLVATLAVISVLLLVGLVLITLRRTKMHRRLSTISDKEELLPDPDEQSSVESLSVEGSPKMSKA